MPDLKSLIVIAIMFKILPSFGQEAIRFKIIENDKIGYIDQNGTMVIQPVFLNGAEFSEGVAAVRINGKYGFIDSVGKFVISPKYDFAGSFKFGLASVYTDGKVQLLNKNGECVLENPDYEAIRLISPNKAVVITTQDKYELIDIPTKKSLVNTTLIRINEFRDGVAVVLRENNPKKDYFDYSCYAVIDTNGRFIVSFGTYSEIKNFIGGYALVDGYENDEKSFEGVIDVKGRLVFKRYGNSKSYLYNDFHDGLAIINFKNIWDAEKNEFSESKKYYQGYINLKGEIVLNNPENNYLSNFSGGRVFIKDSDGKYRLYNTQFDQVSEELFDFFRNPGFIEGVAVVKKKHLWGLIDTNGNYLFEPKFDGIIGVDYQNQLVIYESDNIESKYTLYGIANFMGEIVGESNIQKVDQALFESGLLKAIINNRLSYVDTKGAIVWQEQSDTAGKLTLLNTEYMLSGYFRAYSEVDEDDLGGFGGSSNSAKLISDASRFEQDKLSILVDTAKTDILDQKYLGFAVFIVNNSGDTMRFNAQDSRLYMKVQAKDKSGKWRDIEHLPNSSCGNSYHALKLAPGHYWSFVTPIYEGEFKTRLRIKLAVKSSGTSKGKKEEETIYSNEYMGSVNPGQFWNKDHHIPTGIMDPYSY